jgi:glutaredoxin-like protein NrdH
MYKLFSMKNCPKCEQVKLYLNEEEILFEELDMSTPESMTELSVNGVFTLSAPVLQMNGVFFTVRDLFRGDTLVLKVPKC